MNQVPMSSVNLDYLEARFTGTARGGGKSRNDVLDAVDRESYWHRILIGKTQRARSNDIAPTPFTFGNPAVPFRRRVSAGLATGMRQLHPSYAALLMNKPDDSSQRLNVIVHPDAQVLRTNPALRKNRSRLGKNQSSPAYGPAAQMHKMPVVGVSVRAGVLAHRGNKYAVRKRNIPNCERIKQMSHRANTDFLHSEETPARRFCHRDKSVLVRPVPKQLSVRA